MKLLIIGHGRHGKDTMAQYFKDVFGQTFSSSSMAAAEIFIFDKLRHLYKSEKECYADRHTEGNRKLWYDLICEYNKDNKSRLAEDIMANRDCYVGMRDREEILECRRKRIFDLIIWVDASERLPLESAESFNIDKDLADIIVDNNSTQQSFEQKLQSLGEALFLRS